MAGALRPSLRSILTIGAAYVAIAVPFQRFGVRTTAENVVAPAAGFALVVALCRGPGTWAGLWLGATLASAAWSLWAGALPATFEVAAVGLLVNLGRALAVVATAQALRRLAPPDRLLLEPRAVIEFSLLGGLLLPAVAGALGYLGLAVLDAERYGRSAWATSLRFAASWSAGILIAGPLLLSLSRRAVPRGRAALEAATCAGAIVVGVVLVHAGRDAAAGHPPVHFLVPLFLWAALRFRTPGVAVAGALAAAVALVAIPLRLPPADVDHALGHLQLAIELLSVTFLLLAAVLEERAEANEKLAGERSLLSSRVAERTAALRVERDFADRVIETLGAAVSMIDLEGRIIRINPAFVRATGWRPDEVLGRSFYEFRPEAERARAAEAFERLRRGEAVRSPEAHLLTRDGGTIEVEFSSAGVRGPDGAIDRIFVTSIDVSDLARARRELEESASLLRATLEAAADGIAVVGEDGRIVAFNRRFAWLWGLPTDLLARGGVDDAVRFVRERLAHPDAVADRNAWLARHPEVESTDEIELRDGRRLARISRPYRVAGHVAGVVYSVRDVTRPRAIERERDRLAEAEGSARRAAEWAVFVAREAVRARDSFLVAASLALRPHVDSLGASLARAAPAAGAPGADPLGPAVEDALATLAGVQATVEQVLAAFPSAELPDTGREAPPARGSAPPPIPTDGR